MSASIFDIQKWNTTSTYVKHDVILYSDSRFYYAKGNVAANTPPVYSSVITDSDTNWVGYLRHPVTQKDLPYFSWRPSYQTQANFEPKVNTTKFGDGYEKRTSDQINFNLLNLDLSFDGLTLDEATAILHFLHKRAAKGSFIFRPSPPFTTPSTDAKTFVCRKWTPVNQFWNNFSIKCTFEEVPA